MRPVITLSLLALLAVGSMPGWGMSDSTPCIGGHGGVVSKADAGCQSAPCCLMGAPRRDDDAKTVKRGRSLPSITIDLLQRDVEPSEIAMFSSGDVRIPPARSLTTLVLRC